MSDQIKQREAQRVHLRAATLDVEKRTVEATVATESPVSFGGFSEILLASGMTAPEQVPLLDSHSRMSISDVVGSVGNLRVEGSEIVGTPRIAAGEKGDRALELMRDGHLTDFSAGYSIEEEVKVPKGQRAVINGREFEAPAGRDLYVATRWSLKEVSLVPIGADPLAKARAEKVLNGRDSGDSHPKEARMEPTKQDLPEDKLAEKVERRSIENAVVDAATIEARAAEIAAQRESKRTDEISELCRLAGVPAERTLALIQDKAQTVESVRKALLAERAEANKPVATRVEVGRDERETFRRGAVAGLHLRTAGHLLTDEERKLARDFASMRLSDIAARCLTLSGERVPYDREELFEAAFGNRSGRFWARGDRQRGFNHTTSDFPLILADAMNKALQRAYANAPITYPLWCRTVSIPDFKNRYVAQLSGAPDFEEVGEGGEVTQMTLSERGENYALGTYAKKLTVTRQTLLNDDLDAFGRRPALLGAAARRTVQKSVSYLINEGALSVAMSDGNYLFDASNHGNYGTTSSALAEGTLQTAMAAMREQTGLAGERIGVMPRFLIVNPRLEFTARKLVESIASTASSGNSGIINPVRGLLTPIVDDFMADATANATTHWALAADNSTIDTVEVGFLDGVDAPTLTELPPSDVLGLQVLAFIDYGVKAIDWRGLYKATGQS